MFEGKTKLSLTQFVSGDAFGEASRRVRVSQVASDFTDASGIWERIGGGTHKLIDDSCTMQQVQILSKDATYGFPKIILGGPDITYNLENYLNTGVDFLIIGEGEQQP